MPIVQQIKKSNHAFVSVWEITETVDELFDMLNPDAEERNKVNRFRLDKRKKEYLASRCIVKRELGILPVIAYKESGKPILTNSDFKISITHTKDFVAVAFSKVEEPGVDIEYPSHRIMNIWTRFIADSEAEFIPETERETYFRVIWCMKEAMFKIIDREGIDFKKHLFSKPFVLKNSTILQAYYKYETEYIPLSFEYIVNDSYYLVYKI